MRSSSRWLSAGALGLVTSARGSARAAGGAQSAPISGIRYEVTFDPSTAPTARCAWHDVRCRRVRAGAASLPAWTPGAYEISNFARWVSNFSAASGGKALDVGQARLRHVAHPRRRREERHGDVRLSRRLARQRDRVGATGTSCSSTARTSSCIPRVGPTDFTATVTVKTEPSWLVTTGMKPAGASRTYSASNYHDLVDMPFFVGAVRRGQHADREQVGADGVVAEGRAAGREPRDVLGSPEENASRDGRGVQRHPVGHVHDVHCLRLDVRRRQRARASELAPRDLHAAARRRASCFRRSRRTR